MPPPMTPYRIALVRPVPIQPSEKWIRALRALAKQKNAPDIIIVRDNEENGSSIILPREWKVLDYKEQQQVFFGEFHPFNLHDL